MYGTQKDSNGMRSPSSKRSKKYTTRRPSTPTWGTGTTCSIFCMCPCVCVFFLAFCPMWKGWQFFLLVWAFQTISGIGKFYRPSFSSKRLKIQNMALIACKGEWSFLLLLVHVVANWQLYSRFKFLFSYTLLYIARYCNARGGKPIICTYLVCNKNKVVPFLFLSQDVVEKQTIWFEKGATKTTFAVLPILTGSQLLTK